MEWMPREEMPVNRSLAFFFEALVIAIALLASNASSPSAAGAERVQLNGAGATFPFPLYAKWIEEYRKIRPDVEINYQSIGSGGGIKQVTDGTVDFGASDGPMTDEQMKEFREKRGTSVLHFPSVLGADVPTYNIAGITQELKFTPEALAGIFLGKITKWNDPELARANPGVNLPASDIVVVHRSDGSGTTYIWTDYLSKVSAEWRQTVGWGTVVNWPVGLGGKGNEGVTGLVKQVDNSLGYVELTYAIQNHLAYGLVRNASGIFVKATLPSLTAAAKAAENIPDDFRVSITNSVGKDAYPISSFTWLLVPLEIVDAPKKKDLTAFLKWMITDGQKFAEPLAYAPLPGIVVTKESKAIASIQSRGASKK
jgi:phosphate transport system substrate-binding protein